MGQLYRDFISLRYLIVLWVKKCLTSIKYLNDILLKVLKCFSDFKVRNCDIVCHTLKAYSLLPTPICKTMLRDMHVSVSKTCLYFKINFCSRFRNQLFDCTTLKLTFLLRPFFFLEKPIFFRSYIICKKRTFYMYFNLKEKFLKSWRLRYFLINYIKNKYCLC